MLDPIRDILLNQADRLERICEARKGLTHTLSDPSRPLLKTIAECKLKIQELEKEKEDKIKKAYSSVENGPSSNHVGVKKQLKFTNKKAQRHIAEFFAL